jgi:hypothetical protein
MHGTVRPAKVATGRHCRYESCFTEPRFVLLFQRAVIEVEVDPSGRLRPCTGAAWRPEPALGEATLHRRLAALVDATDARLAAFASTYGLLRVHGNALFGGPGPASVAATVAIGQEALDDGVRVEEWFDSGAIGDPPPGTEDTVLVIELYTALPDWVFDTFESADGPDGCQGTTDPALFLRVGLPVATATSRAIEQHGFDLARFRRLDPSRVRRAFRVNEWVNRVVGGIDDVPASLAALGGADGLIRQLIATAPELFVVANLLPAYDQEAGAYLDALAAETVDDWRAAAAEHRDLVRSIDLVGSALRPTGLSAADKHRLAALHANLAGYRSSVGLAAAEIAERTRPLLAASLEAKLAALGTWPVRRGTLAGVHVRSLVAAWIEVTAGAPLAACMSPGCGGTFMPTRNRRYCDTCRSARRRADVRRARAATSSERLGD